MQYGNLTHSQKPKTKERSAPKKVIEMQHEAGRESRHYFMYRGAVVQVIKKERGKRGEKLNKTKRWNSVSEIKVSRAHVPWQ